MVRSFRERFAAFRAQAESPAPPITQRRSKARRIQLRVANELLLQLAVIKVAEGRPSNKFCEAAIAEAAAKRISELRNQFSVGVWNTIMGAAHAEWRQGIET